MQSGEWFLTDETAVSPLLFYVQFYWSSRKTRRAILRDAPPAETPVLCLLTAVLLAVFAEQTCASLSVQRNENLFNGVGVAGVEM